MRLLPILIALSLSLQACGDRLPSPQTAHRVMTKNFQKYGKKYKTSDFGRHKVEKVEVAGIREVQKNLAEVEGLVGLEDGTVYHVRVTLEKKPFGWRYVSWEKLGDKAGQ